VVSRDRIEEAQNLFLRLVVGDRTDGSSASTASKVFVPICPLRLLDDVASFTSFHLVLPSAVRYLTGIDCQTDKLWNLGPLSRLSGSRGYQRPWRMHGRLGAR
jgi:hypothetical protein